MRVLAVLLPIIASVAFAQGSPGYRYPMTASMVANFLRANGVAVTSSQVHLPMQLKATAPEPQFEIAGSRTMNNGELRLELRCHPISECPPFYVSVDIADTRASTAVVQAESSSNSFADLPLAHKPATVDFNQQQSSSRTGYLRLGSRVVLAIRDGRMQIRLPVIAMDSGSSGTQVRVCTLDRKKIFHAFVVDSALVRGILQ